MRQTSLEEMILETQGLRGLKNRAITQSLYYAIKKAKDHFGIEMTFDFSQVKAATEWVKVHDKDFKSHIMNPYMLDPKLGIASTDPIINTSFILKLEKGTFAFIKGNCYERADKNEHNLYIYIFGKKTLKYFRELKEFIKSKHNSSNMMYSIVGQPGGANGKDYWTCTGSALTPRPMDTLFFDNDTKDRIINHLNSWVSNQKVYTDRGLLFKTGILLYGKAGTGKSSLASAIANYLDCGLITIDTTTFSSMNISEITEAINADEDRYVVLIDEIDTIFKSRDDEEGTDKQKENTAKLLSFLDSQQSPTNVVFVATTNYKERLDKAVIRKGRFDLAIELGDIDEKAAREMCRSFNMSEYHISELLRNTSFPVNPAELQATILEIVANKPEIEFGD